MKNMKIAGKAVIAVASVAMLLGCTPDGNGLKDVTPTDAKSTVKTTRTTRTTRKTKKAKKARKNFSQIITAESIRKNMLKCRLGYSGEKFKAPYEYIGVGSFKSYKISKTCQFYILKSLDHPGAGTRKADIKKTAKIISLYKTKTFTKTYKKKKIKYDANIPFKVKVKNGQVVKMTELHQS